MLNVPTPFPQVGSFALYQDLAIPLAERRSELARILERGPNDILIALPLRDAASGNQRVSFEELIDATELTPAENLELAEIARALRGRSLRKPKQKAQLARHDALRSRLLWSGCLQRQLDRLNFLKRRQAA